MSEAISIVKRPRKLLLWAILIAVAPLALTAAIVQHEFGRPLTSFKPCWSDEVFYWSETRNIHDHGLDFGSFNLGEHVGIAAKQFDSHGPAYPSLYSFFALISGWTYSTPLFWNAALVGLSMFAFIRMAKLDSSQMLLFSFLVVLYLPILMYIPSMLQESMQYCLALLLGGCIVRMVRSMQPGFGAKLDPGFLFYALALVAVLLRPPWSIAFIGFLPFISWRNRFILLLEMVSAWIWMKFFWVANVSTYGKVLSGSPLDALQAVWNHLTISLPLFLGEHWGNWPAEAEILLRYQALLLVGVVAAFGIIAWKKAKGWRKIGKQDQFLFLFHLANIGGIILALVLFYDVFEDRDYRTLAPHLLLSICVMLAYKRFTIPLWAVAISNVLFFNFLLSLFDFYHAKNFADTDQDIQQFHAEIGSVLHYAPNASMWDNSILVAPHDYNDMHEFLALPSGFGISLRTFSLPVPLKSKYLIGRPAVLEDLSGTVQLRAIKTTSHGTLYENISDRSPAVLESSASSTGQGTVSQSDIWAAEQTAAKNPTANNYQNLSLLNYRAKRYNDCIVAARKAISLDPDLAMAYNNICIAYNHLGNFEEARKAGEEAVRLEPANQLFKNNLNISLDGLSRKGNVPIPK